MTKEKLISAIICIVMITSAAFAQRRTPPTATTESAQPRTSTTTTVETTSPKLTIGPGKLIIKKQQSLTGLIPLFTWQPSANYTDGYESSYFPQPVCGVVGATSKIYVFTNFGYYPSQSLNNQSNSVRVGEVTTLADTYQLLPPPHNLPGSRREFAVASIIKSGDVNSTMYLFGGTDGTNEKSDVYSYRSWGSTPGFTNEATIPSDNVHNIPGWRAGATAVTAANGKIYLFGGHQGNTLLKQVLEFDPATGFTPPTAALPQPMPQGLYGLRGVSKGTGANAYIYLVGGITQSGGAPGNKIYRFHVQSGVTIELKDSSNNPLTIPNGSGRPMIALDPSGNVLILASGQNGASGAWTWGNVEAWTLNDTAAGTATLTANPYTDATRARDAAGAVMCGVATYLVGGTYGHGASFQNRGMLVDKLN